MNGPAFKSRFARVLGGLAVLCGVTAGMSGEAQGQVGLRRQTKDLVHVRLLADVKEIVPGEPFNVGLMIDVSPGWHIYWHNPGDSGQATVVNFEVPEGFTVSEVRFPAPMKFLQPGDLVGYGYHGQVMVTATVTPPKDLAAGSSVRVGGKVSYLVCERVCIPGSDSAAEIVQVGKVRRGANQDDFQLWQSRVPTEVSKAPGVRTVEADATGVTIQWNEPGKDVEFFPGPSEAVALENIGIVNSGKKTQVLFAPKYYDKSKLGPMYGVVAYTDAKGERRAMRVELSLKEESKKGG